MRLVFWNCNMALHRKMNALMALRPDIAVIGECADPDTLAQRGVNGLTYDTCVWTGKNCHKGLAALSFGGYRLARADPFYPTLKYLLPVHVTGPASFNLMAVWAQNASAGISRKRQLGPLRLGLAKYRDFLSGGRTILGGDLNNNAIWDKPGWRTNHMAKVAILDRLGMTSAYHARTGEPHGKERTPTLYWRDRTRDGPTYHLDYAFLPARWLPFVTQFQIGSFDDWIATRLSDHVPLVLDLELPQPSPLPI